MSPADRVCAAVNGAAGKMGRRVVALLAENPRFVLTGAYERDGHPDIGKDSGVSAGCPKSGVPIKALSPSERNFQVLIDFSSPEGAELSVQTAQAVSRPVVVCTTALTPQQEKKMAAAAKKIAIVYAPNMSLGMNLLAYLSEQTAKFLGSAYDMEVVEIHHRLKKDAPSGSAKSLAAALKRGRGGKFTDVHGREGMVGARNASELGVHAIRGGDVVGDHTVHFLGAGERLELVHRASTRDTFAAGAIRAAEWVLGEPAGLYFARLRAGGRLDSRKFVVR